MPTKVAFYGARSFCLRLAVLKLVFLRSSREKHPHSDSDQPLFVYYIKRVCWWKGVKKQALLRKILPLQDWLRDFLFARRGEESLSSFPDILQNLLVKLFLSGSLSFGRLIIQGITQGDTWQSHIFEVVFSWVEEFQSSETFSFQAYLQRPTISKQKKSCKSHSSCSFICNSVRKMVLALLISDHDVWETLKKVSHFQNSWITFTIFNQVFLLLELPNLKTSCFLV